MPKNTGKKFEELARQVFEKLSANSEFTSVDKDVMIEGPDGPRQFDVVVRSIIDGEEILTVIECKDYKKKNVGFDVIDAFESKIRDIGAQNAIIVARKGFQSGAHLKARRKGITLCTAHDIDGNLENIVIRVPVVFRDVIDLDFSPRFRIYIPHGFNEFTGDPIPFIANERIDIAFDNALHRNQIALDPLNTELQWHPEQSNDNYFIDDTGIRRGLENVSVDYILRGKYYFGYLHDLPNTTGLNNLSTGMSNLFFESADLNEGYKDHFEAYDRFEDLPKIKSFWISSLKAPSMRIGYGTKINFQSRQLDPSSRKK